MDHERQDLQIHRLNQIYHPINTRPKTTHQKHLIFIVNILDHLTTRLKQIAFIFQHHLRDLLYNQFVLIIKYHRLYISLY